jgi:hypothetical protein
MAPGVDKMNENSDVQRWAIATSTNASNGRKIFFRYAMEFSSGFDRLSQPDRIIIVWTYQSENGQPIKGEHARMDLMEDTLASVLPKAGFATLALVSTGENLREWTYYARSEDEFMDLFNLALTGMPVFPIDIHIEYDPTWSMYSKFLAGVKVSTVN